MNRKLNIPGNSVQGSILDGAKNINMEDLMSVTGKSGLYIYTPGKGRGINIICHCDQYKKSVFKYASLVSQITDCNRDVFDNSKSYRYLYVVSLEEYNASPSDTSTIIKYLVSGLNEVEHDDVVLMPLNDDNNKCYCAFYPSEFSNYCDPVTNGIKYGDLLSYESELDSEEEGQEVDIPVGLKVRLNGMSLKEWAAVVSFKQFYSDISKTVVGQENLKLILANIYSYLHNYANGQRKMNNNMLLAAPSGSGKTETYRAIRAYFAEKVPSLPVSIVDTNQITPEGYKGADTSIIVQRMKDMHSSGLGIVFLDEFDKRLSSFFSSSGEDTNRSVQSQLLMVLEGYVLDGVDTSQTMFIGMGSFNQFRLERDNTKTFGFIENTLTPPTHFDEITRENMISLGASYELIGRFSFLVNYHTLSYEAVDRIIDMRVDDISREMNIKLSISPGMRNHLHDNANTEFGNRLIASILRQSALTAYVEMLEKNKFGCSILLMGNERYRLIDNNKEAV